MLDKSGVYIVIHRKKGVLQDAKAALQGGLRTPSTHGR